MKTRLTIEQSQHLIDLGVPQEKANNFRMEYDGMTSPDLDSTRVKIFPIFELEDFLNGEILPKETVHRSCISVKWNFLTEKWDVDYDCTQGSWCCAKELINALYELTCWYYGEYLKSGDK